MVTKQGHRVKPCTSKSRSVKPLSGLRESGKTCLQEVLSQAVPFETVYSACDLRQGRTHLARTPTPPPMSIRITESAHACHFNRYGALNRKRKRWLQEKSNTRNNDHLGHDKTLIVSPLQGKKANFKQRISGLSHYKTSCSSLQKRASCQET